MNINATNPDSVGAADHALALRFGQCSQCEDPASGRDRLCPRCRGFLAAKNNFKQRQGAVYPWDGNKDLRLKRCYENTKRRQLSQALSRLSGELRYPKAALRRRAEQLGITIWSHVRWTDEELQILAEYAGEKTVGWITKTLKRRTGIGRSYNAVKCKAEEIGRSLRLGSGYSRNDIVQLFGTTQSTVAKWFAMGWLVADDNGRCWEEDIVQFLRAHPSEWHFKRVDEAWVKGLLFESCGLTLGRRARRRCNV
jgi:hypothetical protein